MCSSYRGELTIKSWELKGSGSGTYCPVSAKLYPESAGLRIFKAFNKFEIEGNKN